MTKTARWVIFTLLKPNYDNNSPEDIAIMGDIIDEIETQISNFIYGNSTYRSVAAIISDYTYQSIRTVKRAINDNNLTISDFC